MNVSAIINVVQRRSSLTLSAGIGLAGLILGSTAPSNAQVVRPVAVNAHDLVYDSANNTVYGSVTGDGTLVPINVSSATAGAGFFTGETPGKIAITDNNQFIYVTHGDTSKITRFNTQTNTFDLSWPLNSHLAEDIATVPTQPHALLVVLYDNGVSPHFAGMTIYDDGVSRSVASNGFDSVAYSDSPTTFYAYQNSISSFNFDQFIASPSGIVGGDNLTGLFGGFGISIKYGGGFVFSSGGTIVDPAQKKDVGTFAGSPFLPDGNSLWAITSGNGGFNFNQYNLTNFQIVRTVLVSGIEGNPDAIVKTGGDSFALTAGGKVYLVNLSGTQVNSLTVSPMDFLGGLSATGTVTIGTPAPAGGAVVTLSANSTSVSIPAQVTIPAGAVTQTFRINTSSVTAKTPVTITATAPSSSTSAVVTLEPYALTSLTTTRIAYEGGRTNLGTVTLTGAAKAGGQVVTLTSSDTTTATVPASVTIPAGAVSARFHITSLSTATPKTTTLTASMLGVDKTVALTIGPPKIAALSFAPNDVYSGRSAEGAVLLTVPAPAGGLRVTLSCNSSSLAVPASVLIPAGYMSVEFRGVASGAVSAAATVTATVPGSSAAVNVAVVP